MPRPKTVSDEQVLDAANRILFERGAADFTLSEIAAHVGLSRAALIQRFKNRDTILRLMAKREVEATRAYLNGLPSASGGQGTWQFLVEIVEGMGDGSDFPVRVHLAWLESRDAELRSLAHCRYQLVQSAIAQRLPVPEPTEAEGVAAMLHAVIAGATMQWIVTRDGPLPDYVLARLRRAMALLFPDEEFANPIVRH